MKLNSKTIFNAIKKGPGPVPFLITLNCYFLERNPCKSRLFCRLKQMLYSFSHAFSDIRRNRSCAAVRTNKRADVFNVSIKFSSFKMERGSFKFHSRSAFRTDFCFHFTTFLATEFHRISLKLFLCSFCVIQWLVLFQLSNSTFYPAFFIRNINGNNIKSFFIKVIHNNMNINIPWQFSENKASVPFGVLLNNFTVFETPNYVIN